MVPLARRVPGVSMSRSVTAGKAGGRAFDDEALEAAVAIGNPAGAELLELVFLRGLGRHGAAGAAENSALRASALLRTKAAAAGSEMPRRFSRASAVSLERVMSVRNRVKLWVSERFDLVGERQWRRPLRAPAGPGGRTRPDRAMPPRRRRHPRTAARQQSTAVICLGYVRNVWATREASSSSAARMPLIKLSNSSSGSANPCCEGRCTFRAAGRCGKKRRLEFGA